LSHALRIEAERSADDRGGHVAAARGGCIGGLHARAQSGARRSRGGGARGGGAPRFLVALPPPSRRLNSAVGLWYLKNRCNNSAPIPPTAVGGYLKSNLHGSGD